MINSTYKKANRLFYTLVLVCLVQLGWAQIYPVQVNSNVIPPYLSSVAKYSTTTDQKYLVNIFTSDLNVVNRQVRLKLYIQGNGIQAQSTPVVVGASPLFINGGESLQLNNLDLAPYFELQNLQGINPLQYSGVLPQGNYSFCIEVYDFITNQPISQKSCTFFYFIYNDPPFLNLPFNHEVIHFQDPQNIIFTWTPRHINATNIEYEFVLIELLDNQAPSNYAFMVGAPIWQTITNNTILHYDFTLPQLTLGKKYAWRVKAVSQPGFGEDAVFNNNGYSEIFDFVYAGNCNAPEFVIAQSVSARQAKIMWQNNPNHLSYIVQYRKLGTEIWFNAPVANNEAQLFDLEPSTTYEFQVGGTCLGDVTTFSAINQFTQPETNVAVIDCGIAPTIDLANVTLYSEALAEDMVFMAADFAVHINEIEGVGTYTGKGWTRLPYLSNIKIAVEFENIKLNSELQLVDGEVRAQYDPEWSNILDVNEVIDVVENVLDNFQESNDTHNHTVNYVIGDVSNIVVEDGKILVTNPDTGMVSNIFDFDQGETTTITDSEGSVYTVDPNGNVSFQGQGVGIANASNTENLNSKGEVIALSNVGAKVVFSRNDQSVAFDDSSANYSGAPNKLAAEYKTIKDGSGNDYPFYYKGIINKEDGKVSYDYVTAQITITDTLIKAKNIVFNVKGIKVNAIDSTTVGNVVTKTLKVPAFTTEGENELLALVKTDSLKQKVVGAMMVVPIKDIGTVNVNLVPVNGATITQADIQEIKNIYGGAGVTLNITTLPAHTDGITTLECGTSGWIANYTNEQNAFIDRFKATTTINNNAYYLFVTKNITPSRPLSGFMPLHRQFGFVFTGQTGTGEIKQTNGSGLATVIAHELAHGAFELEHPWEKYDYDKNAYATNWLMDYANGTKLPYRHWQQISHPKTKLYLFQSDESGESVSVNVEYLKEYANKNANGEIMSYSFIAPSGLYITLEKDIKNITVSTLDRLQLLDGTEIENKVPVGALISFKDKNDVVYSAYFEGNTFKGFKKKDSNNEFYIDILSKNLNPDSGICLFLGVESNKFKTYYGRFSSDVAQVFPNEGYKAEGTLLNSFAIFPITNVEINWKDFLGSKAKNNKFSMKDTLLDDFYFNNRSTSLYNLFYDFRLANSSEITPVEFLEQRLSVDSKIKEYLFYFEIINMEKDDFQSFANCLQLNTESFRNKVRLDYQPNNEIYESASGNLKQYLELSLKLDIKNLIINQSVGNTNDLNTLIADINENPNLTGQQIYTRLTTNYLPCAFSSIDLNTRIKILNKLLSQDDEYWLYNDTKEHFLIYDLVISTPVADRVGLLNNGFITYSTWLTNLWNEAEPAIFNNDVNLDGVTTLISELSNWVLEYYPQLNFTKTFEEVEINEFSNIEKVNIPRGLVNPIFLGKSEDNFSFKNEDGYDYKISLINKVEVEYNRVIFKQDRVGFSRIASLNEQGQAVYLRKMSNLIESFHPFEPVLIKLGNNYSFLDFGENDISKKEIVVPSILAALYLQKIENNQTQHNVRQVGNAVAITFAIIGTPITGGGSLAVWSGYLATAGGIVGAVDIPAQQFKQSLIANNQYEQYKEAYEAWDVLYNTVGIAEGAVGISQLGVAIRNYAYIKKWNAFSNKVKNLPENNATSYIKNKWNLIKGADNEMTIFINKITGTPLLSKYNSLPENLKPIFRADFRDIDVTSDIFNLLKKNDSELFQGWKNFRANHPTQQLCTF